MSPPVLSPRRRATHMVESTSIRITTFACPDALTSEFLTTSHQYSDP
jgi:hypothetical protein